MIERTQLVWHRARQSHACAGEAFGPWAPEPLVFTQQSTASLGSSEMEETNVDEKLTECFLEEVIPDRMYLVWGRGIPEGRNAQARGGPEWG